ncbi:ankyrin repeat domain-containing protein [Ruegeria sediminis]|uniref:Ankyrin repeat domain-containing protein n=1 Tax=Ruegeria sediminis TaxID=2583820 RepID=A0ABY2X4N7_9RHOB|nr:ankyrin repeat domain-containing protein [Ruegeria sediminis]TMV09924.1 ankyrin repeat domain-containing protein [Ruegeria sediminis]
MFKHILVLLVLGAAVPALAQTAPSPSDIAGYQGLHRAAHEGSVTEIVRLAAEGADVNARDRRRRTPAHVAAFASHDDSLRALAEAGADMNALEGQDYDVVTIAAVADDPALMSLAIELGNDPGLVTSPYEGTALIAAAHLGHVEVVRRLIEAGAPLDHVNNLGWTALMESVVLGDGGPDHQVVARLLVEAGADRGIGDFDGVTPLEHAKARGFSEMVSILSGK